MTGAPKDSKWGSPEQVKFVIGFVEATKRTGAELCRLHVDFLLAVLAELERLRINAAVDERLDRVERELSETTGEGQ